MTTRLFTVYRSSVSGWTVTTGDASRKVASFGQDEDRARALAMDLNATLESHLGHHAAAERARLNATGMDAPAQRRR
jgi:hypothetical protein